jgi:putative inorganic carbon (hco3(-)) transporter
MVRRSALAHVSTDVAQTSTHAKRTPFAQRVEHMAWLLFVSLLIIFPWFYGGNRDWAWGILLVGFSLLLIAVTLTNALPNRMRLLLRQQKWLLLVLCGWLLLPLLQIGLQQSGDVGASFRSLMKTLLYTQAMLLIWTLLDSRARLKQLLQCLFVAAFLHATLASFALLSQQAFRSEFVVFGAAGSMGTFVNKNHFAGFVALHLGIGAGLLVSGLRYEAANELSGKQKLRSIVQLLMDRKTQLRLGMIVMVVALVLSRSRMGNIAFFISLLITGLVSYVAMVRRPPALGLLLVSIVVIDLVVIGGWFGARELAERISNTQVAINEEKNLSTASAPAAADPLTPTAINPNAVAADAAIVTDRERPGVSWACWHMFKTAPIFGIGAGAFRAVFPSFRPSYVSDKFYDHAHNDWMQLLAEYGLVGVLLAGALLLSAYRNLVLVLRYRRSRLVLGSAFGALFGLTALIIHGLADFNLQIPANALIFSVLFALSVILRHGYRLRGMPVAHSATLEMHQ